MKILVLVWLLAGMPVVWAQADTRGLGQLSTAFQRLSKKVSPSVVKVVAVGYRQLEPEETDEPGVAAKQQSAGSGVLISMDGQIVTNAHLVVGSQKVQVTLPLPITGLEDPRSAVKPFGKVVPADILGIDLETDIALLKVAGADLPFLTLGDSEKVEQGQVVLAFGSPMGLDNSMTMGVVSSPARQFRPDDSMIYLQTDAPINPGNSGGPLVNTDGEVVGINTLILSQSGGSEGLGFAVPSNLVANVVEQLRRNGKVVRGEIGVQVQTITPALALGWRLPQEWGVVVGDVEEGSPAAKAGLRTGDVIAQLNGKRMENARQFNVQFYRPLASSTAELEVMRGKQKLTINVEVEERHDEAQGYAELSSREENLVVEIGVFAIDLTEALRDQLGPFRRDEGVLVAARSADGPYLEDGFRAGDVIYALNRQPIPNVAALRAQLKKLRTGDAAAFQVERLGKLRFVGFQMP